MYWNNILNKKLHLPCKCVKTHVYIRVKRVELFYYQLMHIILKNTELLKHSKITLQHVSVYIETIFREHKVSAWLKIYTLVNSICIKDVQGVVSAMAAYCDNMQP